MDDFRKITSVFINMPTAKSGSSMEFETTALTLDGVQKDTYYGSIKWGWKINENNKPVTEPNSLQVVDQGSMSDEMKERAKAWNKAEGTTEIPGVSEEN